MIFPARDDDSDLDHYERFHAGPGEREEATPMSATAELLEVVTHYRLSQCPCGRWRRDEDLRWNLEATVGYCSTPCEEEAQVSALGFAVKVCAACRKNFVPRVFVAGLPQLCDGCLNRQDRARDMFVSPEGG